MRNPFTRKLRHRIEQLEQQKIAQQKEIAELRTQLREALFRIDQPPKYKMGDKMKEGTIVEVRMGSNYPSGFLNPWVMVAMAAEILAHHFRGRPYNTKLLEELRAFMSQKWWEYRMAANPKWIREEELTPIKSK